MMEAPRDANPGVPPPAPEQHSLQKPQLPPGGSQPTATARKTPPWWEGAHVYKVALFIASLYLFVLAIALMRDGAAGLALLLRSLSINNPANSLGFGWLSAYVLTKGSPAAAAALTFFNAGLIGKLDLFAMIAGSRLGASFVVLYIGFLYVLRGRYRSASLSTGVLSFAVTATIYVPGFALGAWLLHRGALDSIQLRSGALNWVTERAADPIATVLNNLLPAWAVFLVGAALVLLSISLFDRCLPQRTLKESQVGWMSRVVYRPWVMFALGALVTLISMSVGASLSILVPLSARGFVRRENVIPYVLGANITTFISTLLAAVILNNPPAVTAVLTLALSIAAVSVLILAFLHRGYQRAILAFVNWTTARNRNLALFLTVILLIPIILILV